MTIDLETKIPYLKTFHEIIYQKGWTFTKSKRATYTSEYQRKTIYYDSKRIQNKACHSLIVLCNLWQ